MKTKTFKIGEYAIGGIIRIQIIGKIIRVQALDWDTKEVVSSGSTDSTDPDWRSKLEMYLQNLSTYYWSDKMMEWVNKQIKPVSLFENWVYGQNVSQI